MKAEEELERLRCLDHNCLCLVAIATVPDRSLPDVPDELLVDGGRAAVVGTLDVAAARAVPGEALVGQQEDAAYMLNVCAAPAVRRRGVGQAMVAAAVDTAADIGAAPC